jgi:hypothetical protein
MFSATTDKYRLLPHLRPFRPVDVSKFSQAASSLCDNPSHGSTQSGSLEISGSKIVYGR